MLNPPAIRHRRVFGVPLEESLAVCRISQIPGIVFRSIELLEGSGGISEVGIYRESGALWRVRQLRNRFNGGKSMVLIPSLTFILTNI